MTASGTTITPLPTTNKTMSRLYSLIPSWWNISMQIHSKSHMGSLSRKAKVNTRWHINATGNMLKWAPILRNLLRKVWSINTPLPQGWTSKKRFKKKWNPNKSLNSPSLFLPQLISPSMKNHKPILPSCLLWGREIAVRELNTPNWIKISLSSTVNLKSAQRLWLISWGYH